MNNNARMLARSVGLLILLIGVEGCFPAYPYSGAAFKLHFVDESGQPIAGVMVLASWATETGPLFKGSITGHGGPQPSCMLLANVETSVSDGDGIATLPSWSSSGKCMTMYDNQPRIVAFKSGYKFLDLYNRTGQEDHEQSTILLTSHSSWDGKTLTLNKLGHGRAKDGEDEQVDNLALYISAVTDAATGFQKHPTRCYWIEAKPAFLVALREERALNGYFHSGQHGFRLMEQVIDESYAPNFYQIGDWTCGPTRPYLEELVREVDGPAADHEPLW